ncbi:hypothetical protein I352_05228 [Cryptococcus deuterogattii MMRL2647]|nr:hypothetical protein I352_05228 [Cryptococcus deuterogattii MMRL2647]
MNVANEHGNSTQPSHQLLPHFSYNCNTQITFLLTIDSTLSITMVNPSDSDLYTIQPIDRWSSPFSHVNHHIPSRPPYSAPGEVPQEPEVDKLASEKSGLW